MFQLERLEHPTKISQHERRTMGMLYPGSLSSFYWSIGWRLAFNEEVAESCNSCIEGRSDYIVRRLKEGDVQMITCSCSPTSTLFGLTTLTDKLYILFRSAINGRNRFKTCENLLISQLCLMFTEAVQVVPFQLSAL
jgi:hypothetical protein